MTTKAFLRRNIDKFLSDEDKEEMDKIFSVHTPQSICIFLHTDPIYVHLIPANLFDHNIYCGAFSVHEGDDCSKMFIDLLLEIDRTFAYKLRKINHKINWTE